MVLPQLSTFAAQQNTERVTYGSAGQQCSQISSGDTFSLGCNATSKGIEFNATVTAPADSISVPSDSRVKFVQLVNIYRQRQTSNGTECVTFRTSPGDLSTGWYIDKIDPYDSRPDALKNFSNNYTASITTNDTPGNTLENPLRYQSLLVNDQFEMYVNYIAGDPGAPSVERPLGKLSWNFGGQATYNASTGAYNYNAANPVPKALFGTATTTLRPYLGTITILESMWKACGTGTTPTPTPTPTPTATPTPTPFPTPTPPLGGGNHAIFVSQTVPTSMEAGQSYNITITMKNTGSTTWTLPNGYRLGTQNPWDNVIFGRNRVDVPQVVVPGAEVSFNFDVTAPSVQGFYNFQWRMVQDGVEWFGEYTPAVLIDVYSANYCDWWEEQDCYYYRGVWDSSSCICRFNL